MKVSSKNWKIAHFGVLFVHKWAKMNFLKKSSDYRHLTPCTLTKKSNKLILKGLLQKNEQTIR